MLTYPSLCCKQPWAHIGVHVDENPETFNEQLGQLIADIRDADPADVQRVVRGVVVGNEAIFRREVTVEELIAFVRRARTELSDVIPGGIRISASDIFINYLRNQNLIDAVDFMVPNTHIFFNRRAPFDIDTQFDTFWRNYDSLQALSPGKEIMVGEFGWPSAGIPKDNNPNNLPCPGKAERVLNRFVCEMAARSPPIGYFYFSAFDAYWKSASHEKHWGVLRNDRTGPKSYVPGALNCANYDPNAPEPVCELTPGPFDLGLLDIRDGQLIVNGEWNEPSGFLPVPEGSGDRNANGNGNANGNDGNGNGNGNGDGSVEGTGGDSESSGALVSATVGSLVLGIVVLL
ncbi:MAG: hypothetical protein SGCHY_003436 [Lobulomycetales sp.]